MSRPERPAAGRRPADRPARGPARPTRPALEGSEARHVTNPPDGSRTGVAVAEAEDEAPPAPWHFKVLLFATAGYLVYRLIWLVFWLTGHAWHG